MVGQCLNLFPTTYKRYIEPFLGGGSVFFALQPPKAILGDSNAQLIETYKEIRRDPQLIFNLLCDHQKSHSNEYYYMERSRQYTDSSAKRAAQFIYLNRTCWNGLYRVNRKGEFNVPRGTKEAVIFDTDDFDTISDVLSRTTLLAQDFGQTMAVAGAGDFVYADPPYTVQHKYNGFLKYNEKIFSWEDQIRLRDEVLSAIERGAFVAVSNADHESVRELYQDIGIHKKISRKSVIAGQASHRGSVDELLILSADRKIWPTVDGPPK